MADVQQSAGAGTGLAQSFGNTYQGNLGQNSAAYYGALEEKRKAAEAERKSQQAIIKKYQEDAASLKNDLLIPKLRNDLDRVNQEAYKEVERILIEDPNNISGAQRVITEAMNEASRFKQFQDEFYSPWLTKVKDGLVNGDEIYAQINSDEVSQLPFDEYMGASIDLLGKGKGKKSLATLSEEAKKLYGIEIDSGLRLAKEQEIRRAYPTASSVEVTRMVDDALATEMAENMYNEEKPNWDKLYPSKEDAIRYIKTLSGDQNKVGLQRPTTTKENQPVVAQNYVQKPLDLEVLNVHNGEVNAERGGERTTKKFEKTIAAPSKGTAKISVSGVPILLRAVHKVAGGSNSYAEGLYMPKAVTERLNAGMISSSEAEKEAIVVRVPIKSSDIPQVVSALNLAYNTKYSNLNDFYKLAQQSVAEPSQQSAPATTLPKGAKKVEDPNDFFSTK